MTDAPFRTAVILPFYQRTSGLLLQAVRSVFAQGMRDSLIIIVDDGSPVSARDELGALACDDPRVMLVEQENAGPGAARNRGLDAVPPDVPYIAFLDSDDRWLPGHLARALNALEHGADFYFADSDHRGRGLLASHFANRGFTPSIGPAIDAQNDTYFYEGDLFDTILRRWTVSTPTVVYRRAIAPSIRFPTIVRRGEDMYFWLELAHRTKRVAFSDCCDAACGHGVNISLNSPWGTPGALRFIFEGALVYRMVDANMPLTKSQRQWCIHEFGRRSRRQFAGTLLHLLRRREKVDWGTVGAYALRDPRLISDVIEIAIGRLSHRAPVPENGPSSPAN